MKAEELMIDDWLCYEGEHNVQVKGIDLPPNGNSAFISFGAEFYPCDSFSPIPLTPEILEKNGFVLKEEEVGAYGINIAPYYMRKDVPFEVFCDGEPFAIWFKDPVNIAFVHQLQHALRLCGIKKEEIVL